MVTAALPASVADGVQAILPEAALMVMPAGDCVSK